MSNDEPVKGASRYPNVLAFVAETPWQILESKLHDIKELVTLKASGIELSQDEIEARIGTSPARRDMQRQGSVAVIPIHGVITPKADLMSEMSGGTSIDRLRSSIQAAADDPAVSSIVLDVDSPGGSVSMLGEAAQTIRQARKVKPVVAVANGMAASAAYRLASQATEFVVTPSGSVGSVGTIAAHEDISRLQENLGVKTTLITAGKYKGELSPHTPLSEDARKHMQSVVDKHQQMFEQDVAWGRGTTIDSVRENFGQGRMLLAKDAQAAGMVDRIDTLDNVLASLQKPASASTSSQTYTVTMAADGPNSTSTSASTIQMAASSGLSFADQAIKLHDDANALVERTTSLAEVERGHLTVAKRERLTACTGALRDAAQALDEVLAATDPLRHQHEFHAIAGRMALEELRRAANP